METAVNAMLMLAREAADVGGRGDNPSDTTGVVTILVVAALVLAAGLLLAYVFTRGRARRRALEPHPDTAGRVGRVGSTGGD
ncbi:MAG: hypothetical protein QOH58_2454 [Thermoleophilaceae bacterium]|jgi:hypothetical protein|nr:hypothetical protein [Thermoleophilaceae bacterium]